MTDLLTKWEPTFSSYYSDASEVLYRLGGQQYDLMQVERTQEGWHGLLLAWEDTFYDVDDEDDVPVLYDDTDPDVEDDSTLSGLVLLDEKVFPSMEQAAEWCEEHLTEDDTSWAT